MRITNQTLVEEMLNLVRGAESLHDLEAVLYHLRDRFGLANIAYHAVRMTNCATPHPILVLTYLPEWVARYVELNYFNIDPVVSCVRRGFLPVDWSELDRDSIAARQFFADADRFSVGRQGITIPIRGPGKERALFTLTSNISPEKWPDQRSLLIFQFQLIAYLIHDQAARISGLRSTDAAPNLSNRELQCLQAIADGLAPKQIAGVLGLSATAVNLYLFNARQKLDSANVPQAAVKALSLDLIEG